MAGDPPVLGVPTPLARRAPLARRTTPGTPAWGAPRSPYPRAPGGARHAPMRPLLLLPAPRRRAGRGPGQDARLSSPPDTENRSPASSGGTSAGTAAVTS